ncbi:MAG: hypothetical protein ACT4PJ_09525 [Gemmatimonadaceae bacterium]
MVIPTILLERWARPRHPVSLARLLRVPIEVVLALCLAAEVTGSQTIERSLLKLEERRVMPLTTSFAVSGATVTLQGSYVVWSRTQRKVQYVRADEVRSICDGMALAPISAAFTNGDATVEVIDAEGRLIRWNESDARCTPVDSIVVTGELMGAVYHEGGWIIAAEDGQGRGVLLLRGRSGGVRHVVESSSRLGSALHLPQSFFSPHPQGLLLSLAVWPFQWRVISTAGGVLAEGQPFTGDTTIVVGTDTARASSMVGLASHRLDRGYVQIVADPKSDIRLFVLYDDSGRRVRMKPVAVSMGILQVLPEHHWLAALRRTRDLELVLYHWRWEPSIH